jgi:hypothetical protein
MDYLNKFVRRSYLKTIAGRVKRDEKVFKSHPILKTFNAKGTTVK